MKRLVLLSALVPLLLLSCGKESGGGSEPSPEPESTVCERTGDGKEIYVPEELRKNNGFRNTQNNFCYARSLETENLIIMWAKSFGSDPTKAGSMAFDPEKLAKKGEEFYSLYRDELHFIKDGSGADKYKMMVMVTYTTEGTVYGGSYDNVIGALWVEPGRIQDERLNAVAHELGHSFQFQLMIDSESGFGSGGIYEMTSQWMLWQANAHWFDDETYHWEDFMKQTHYAFMHPENMYHTANVLEYWSYLHGQGFIADLWRAAKGSNDVVGVYKTLTGIDQEKFNEENYDMAARQICYDLPRIKEACAGYANRHSSTLKAADAEGWQSISDDRVPQQYGYNGIRLEAPAAGESVSVEFRGDSGREEAGWRFGFVGTKKDGTIVYGQMNSVSGTGGTVSDSFTADADYSHLWLVVTAAPSVHRFVSEENSSAYVSYPYSVKLTY